MRSRRLLLPSTSSGYSSGRVLFSLQGTLRHFSSSSTSSSVTTSPSSNPDADQVSPIVTGEWLAKNIDKVKVLDGSWSLKRKKGQPWKVQIPGAAFFDIDDIADQRTWLPHMLPTPEEFEKKVTQLGVQNSDHIVIYDHSNGQFVASARVWWSFRVFGHHKVSVLAQGFEGWPNGLQIPPEDSNKKKEPFRAKPTDRDLVWDWSTVLMHIDPDYGPSTYTVIDARSADRFYARVDEPREDVPRGSIPNSRNIPYMSLFNSEKRPSRTGSGEVVEVFSFKEKEELAQVVKKVIDPTDNIATSCGTGVTASVLALGLYTLGNKAVAVYDGSWTEWGLKDNTPKVKMRIDGAGRLEKLGNDPRMMEQPVTDDILANLQEKMQKK